MCRNIIVKWSTKLYYDMDISLFDKLFRDGQNWLGVIKFTDEVMMREWSQIWIATLLISFEFIYELLYIVLNYGLCKKLEQGEGTYFSSEKWKLSEVVSLLIENDNFVKNNIVVSIIPLDFKYCVPTSSFTLS